VLDSASLERTGQPDLIQAMAQTLPSFTAQAVGGDTASMTLSARLRGLSPNNTLVLINGKRRHTTSNLSVIGGPYQGGAAADLNYIPVAAIDHIEVLQDGAAAQYGTDAIAGVINIILKKDAAGGSISVTGGRYYDEGGRTGDASANIGFAPNEHSFVNLSAETKYHGHSNRGGIDPRAVDPATLAADPSMRNHPGYPYVNKILGDAAYHQQALALNAGYDLGAGLSLYSFGTHGLKTAASFQNYRLPDRLPSLYRTGFSPAETLRETDFGITFGGKGRAGKWNWDLSTTHGKDDNSVGVINTGNISLLADTGATPTAFHAGGFIASQWTNNFDLSRDYEIGWSSPLSVAFGLEQRTDTYEITAGDPASRYKEGPQGFAGFLTTDAARHSRNNKAIYVDVAGSPIDKLKLDVAARFEKFSDFGNTRVGKLTGRYDFSPQVALRSTISNGFRAPTMAEQYYSSTIVSPFFAVVQLPPTSPGAAVVGINGLKPETSTNYSIGLVLHPAPRLTITADAYQIEIRDRIVGSGMLFGSGAGVNSAAVVQAIKTNGNVLDPTVAFTGINVFTNALNTRTRGGEIVTSYASNYNELGRVDWSASANYNQVKVTRINQAPAQLLPQSLLDQAALSDLETAAPKFRINLGALWKKGNWSVNLRETIYGPSSEYATQNGIQYFNTELPTKAITDLEISNRLTKSLTLSVGANNLFNQYPNKTNGALLAAQRAALDPAAVRYEYPQFSPFGLNGGYYYARMNYTF
jgi:iron complex outermembrane receptor protein